MLDAEEAVPSRVWDAVSAELDKAAAPKVVFPLWRRVIPVAAAVAAAVALGVFLALPRGGASDPVRFDKVISEAPARILEPGLVAPKDIVLKDRRLAEIPSSARAEEATAVPEAPAAGVPAAEEPAAPAETTARPSSVPSRPDGSSDEAAFNAIAFEQMQGSRGGKFSASAGGNVLTNGNPTSTRNRYMRTSSTVPRTGISEGTDGYFGIPVSVGIGLGYRFAPKWSVATGLVYTSLSRRFNGTFTEIDGESGTVSRSVKGDIDNTQHYLGIPLNLQYHMIDGERIRCYSFIGGTVERCLSDRYLIHSADNFLWTKASEGVQFSAAVGLGIEFALTPHVGIYVDPSIRYWFDCGQSKSIRTQQPLMAGMEAGIRFGW